MDVTTASNDLQGFIDYLASDKDIEWHFINDPRWSNNMGCIGNHGWCGSVQLNFYRALYKKFPKIGKKCRRFTFYSVGDSHCVTWYDGIIIDTSFNLLVYKGKYLSLTNSPIIDRPKDCLELYYRAPSINWNFEQLTLTKVNSFSKQYFPPFLP